MFSPFEICMLLALCRR